MNDLRELLQSQPATVFALSLTAFLLYKLSRKANGAQGKPPVVPYVVPWVGSAITMGKDPDAFFKNAKYASVILIEGGG